MRHQRFFLMAASGAAVTLALSQPAMAAGFAVSAQSAYGMGNAYAGNAAVAKDASTVLTNPAGIFELEKPVFGLSASLTSTNVDFTDRGTRTNAILGAAPVATTAANSNTDLASNSIAPAIYYARQLNDKWAFGFGFNVPFSSRSEYDDNWVGRYHAVKTEVTAFDLNPSVAYRINDKVSIGGGISVQFASALLTSKLDSGATCFGVAAATALPEATCANAGLTPNNPDIDSDVELDGTGTEVTFNLGILLKPREGTKIGVAYRHGSQHQLKGDADFTMTPALAAVFNGAAVPILTDTGTTISADLPASLDFSVAQQANDQLELLGTIKWTQWSSFDRLTSDFDNPAQASSGISFDWEDTITASAGFNYIVNSKFTARAGFQYDQSPVPNPRARSPRGAANNRYWYSVGGTYQFSERISANFAATHLQIDESAIDNTGDGAGAPTLRGLYEFGVNLLAFQLNWHFI